MQWWLLVSAFNLDLCSNQPPKKKIKIHNNPRNKQKKSHSILNCFCQQVESCFRNRHNTKWRLFLSFFSSWAPCSCLRRFTWGSVCVCVFGSEWQENVTGTSTGLCGIPRVFPTSLATLSAAARCRIHFTLDRSLLTWGGCTNKEQFNCLSCFDFPNMQKDVNERERREKRKLCERNYNQAKNCLVQTWTVKVEHGAKCVCLW